VETGKTSGSVAFGRRALLRAFAATALVAAPTYSKAFGLLRGAGDIRRLRMHSAQNGEDLDVIYWVDGQYVPEALTEINYFMRDWRQQISRSMDTRTLDITTAAHALMDTDEPYLLLSGYRTPQTNAYLRTRSAGVAKDSLHMRGQANDLRLKSRSVGQIYQAAMRLQAGGVGRYPRSNFVHMDCGQIRTWAG